MMTMSGLIANTGKSSSSLLVGLVLLVGLALSFAFIPNASKGYCQLALLPLILFASARFRILGRRIPRLFVFLAAVGAVLGAVAQFWHVNLASGAFLVSSVGEQDLHKDAKIYRDRIRRIVSSDAESLVGLYPGVIRDYEAAKHLLDRNDSIAGVIWGSSRWMNVALRRYEPFKLSSFSEESVVHKILFDKGIAELILTRSVPLVGLSNGQGRGTVRFIGEIVRAWHSVPKMLVPGADLSDFERYVGGAARMQVRWTSRSHLALPLWLNGTAHLIKAIEGGVVEHGELRCALSELKEALSLFRTHDNPALEMSVRNTYAVALLVESDASSEMKKLERKALQHLAAAVRLRKYNQEIGAVVALNYLGLAQSIKGGTVYDRKK
jgi:hypothetical protein